MSAAELEAMELQFQIERLLAQYIHCIDSDQLEELPDFFIEKGRYRVISRENVDRGYEVAAIFCDSRGMLADRIVSLRHANIYETQRYRHVLSSTLVTEINADSVHAISNYVVYRSQTDGRTDLYSAGQYQDHIVRRDGQWFFAEKDVVFDTNLIDTLMVIPL